MSKNGENLSDSVSQTPEKTFSDVLFCPQTNDVQFTVIEE